MFPLNHVIKYQRLFDIFINNIRQCSKSPFNSSNSQNILDKTFTITTENKNGARLNAEYAERLRAEIEIEEMEERLVEYKLQKEENAGEFKNLLPSAHSLSLIKNSHSLDSVRQPLESLKEDCEEQEYTKFLETQGLSSMLFASCKKNENVLVVQPKIRWGSESTPKNTTIELQMEEAVTLCRTLPGFNVVAAVIVGTNYNTKRKLIWGVGRLEKLLSFKLSNNVTALMINTSFLTPLQQSELSAYFHVPIYDRYNVVLSIFKIYARTQEAFLQISLAEIPYIRHRLKIVDSRNVPASVLHVNDSTLNNCSKGEKKFEILRQREHTLRKRISAAIDLKANECERRRNTCQPIKNILVAVIGYTNAGKTTLIKKLTDSKTLHGENRLFATLDTSIHNAVLPSRLKVILADTIGFISNLPISLFASFMATLRHVVNADVLIHIQDVSHPNRVAQQTNVLEILHSLQIRQSLIDSMISVGNKTDRTPADTLEKFKKENLTLVSCQTGDGFQELISKIDLAAQLANGSRLRRLKLSPSSKAIAYLYEYDLVYKSPMVSDCGSFLLFDVYMNNSQMAKFQANVKIRKLPT